MTNDAVKHFLNLRQTSISLKKPQPIVFHIKMIYNTRSFSIVEIKCPRGNTLYSQCLNHLYRREICKFVCWLYQYYCPLVLLSLCFHKLLKLIFFHSLQHRFTTYSVHQCPHCPSLTNIVQVIYSVTSILTRNC